MEATDTDLPSVSGKVTLLVKHLPESLQQDTLTRLFSHYGATDVRPCVAGKLRNCAFVDFKDDADASRAQSQFNRLRFLNKVLVVERANLKPEQLLRPLQGSGSPNVATTVPPDRPSAPASLTVKVESESKLSSGAPIAPSLGIDYPFPPHLEYSYPPPDGNILTNIVNALIAVPRLYTQVLHLMNKMNLPPPFRPAMPTPPLPPSPPPEPPPAEVPMPPPQEPDSSSEESELKSSSEEEAEEGKEGFSSRARKKRKMDVGLPPKGVDLSRPAVVQKPGFGPLIKKKAPVMQFKLGVKKSVKAGGSAVPGEGKVAQAEEEGTEPHGGAEEALSKDWLRQHRVPPEEILATPMFKNYSPGVPTHVLYVKNLAKDVVADDLLNTFEVFFDSREEARSLLTVKLMQEGRMKGQAFVTFPTVELAQEALDCAHGYKLKEKAMVIQFGRKPIEKIQDVQVTPAEERKD